VRHLATQYPYDSEDETLSLRGDIDTVSDKLEGELSERLGRAGVKVIEARLSHLAYAPEIAGAMLRRQQADAIIAARFKIVEGAVGMVENALEALSSRGIIELDDERRAAMVSNLMVVLCGQEEVHPIINAGSLY
jgi:regulator of protease activity HflC (stomatin/prohibitin superfamily)